MMIRLVLSFLFMWEALFASSSPLISNFGEDAFRSGEVSAVLGNQSQYDFFVTFTSPLGSSSVSLALSMVDYNQSMNAISNFKVFFHLLENTPSASNASHGAFRVQLGLYSLTLNAKVKYLAYQTSILSQNFNIIVSTINPPTTLASYSSCQYTVTTSLNTASNFTYSIWFSGVEAWKSSSGN